MGAESNLGRLGRTIPRRVAQPAGEPHRILTTPSDRDDRDDCGRVRLGGGSVARWREDFQNDFAGRMRWAVTPEKDRANHAPVVVLNGMKGSEVLRIAARTGDTVKLSAAGSFDPDGNKFGYDWWIYREAGSLDGAWLNGRGESVELDLGPLTKDAKGTIHVIVRARDGGSPWMASYRRAVVSVEPMPKAKMFIDPGHPGHPDWEAPHRELPDGEFPAPATAYDRKKLRLERFGRGVVAWRDSFDTVCVGWRRRSHTTNGALRKDQCLVYNDGMNTTTASLVRNIALGAAFASVACPVFGEWKPAPSPLTTEWGEKVTPENAWREYPRPQLVRNEWTNLNGMWEYAVTSNAGGTREQPWAKVDPGICAARGACFLIDKIW